LHSNELHQQCALGLAAPALDGKRYTICAERVNGIE